MTWLAKAATQNVLSFVPRGERLNYVFQRHVTRSLTISERTAVGRLVRARRHLRAIEELINPFRTGALFFEFGTGWHLGMALAFHCLGAPRQIVTDVRRLARPRLVREMVAALRRVMVGMPGSALAPIPLGAGLSNGDFESMISEDYGIEYRAPCDPSRTGLPDRSVDCITSTFTLEHVPPAEIPPLLRECRRLLRPGGVASFLIDYQDHYSYTDTKLSRYHFLRFPDRVWHWVNPPAHFQNRLRHRDYLELFRAAGLEVVSEGTHEPNSSDLRVLGFLPLAPRFRSYSQRDLGIRSAHVVLRKAS
jgi:SAM-dependent methyltransferase